MKRKYRFNANAKIRFGAKIEKASPDEIGAEIYGETGVFSSKEILEKAKKKSSPIHQLLEWDNEICGERYRIKQINDLVGCLVVSVAGEDVPAFISPVYVEVGDTEQRYVSIEQAKASESIWGQVLEKAWKDLLLWRDRYQKLEELGPVIKAIELLKQKEFKRSNRN